MILTELWGLEGVALNSFLLYWSWERYFTSRDDDTGLAVALIAVYFKLTQYLFVLYNYRKGVYHQMLGMKSRKED